MNIRRIVTSTLITGVFAAGAIAGPAAAATEPDITTAPTTAEDNVCKRDCGNTKVININITIVVPSLTPVSPPPVPKPVPTDNPTS